MVDTDDVQGYQNTYENQMERLEAADIDARDQDEIETWILHLRTNDERVDSLGTVIGHLNRIRLAAERAHVPLVEFESVDDVNAFKLHLEDRHGLSEGTIRNYMKALRKFYAWREEPWADDITVGSPPDRKHDPDEEITADELDAMLEAANQFDAASREKALIALLRDTGLRIGAVLSFQLKHVDFDGKRGTIRINEAGNVKGADGPKPVTWSRGYVSNWLDDHPRRDDPEAALIHKTRHWSEGEDGALRARYAASRIKTIAREADLDAERIHAHLFRGTAISEWIRGDMDEQMIKHRVDWDEDSRQFGTYSRVSDEEMNDVIFDTLDIGDAAETQDLVIEACPLCDSALRGTETYCPSCAAELSQVSVEEKDAVQEGTVEYLVEEDDATKRAAAAEFAEAIDEDPTFARLVFEHLNPESTEAE